MEVTPAEVDASNWSGEGTFTQLLLERLRALDAIRFLRVEDAPATRSEADYNFISNEIFVSFANMERRVPVKWLGFLPGSRVVAVKAMTIAGLEAALTDIPDIGAADYADGTMLQYLRTERIVPPYQTRGYKLVELVRIYEVGTARPA
jgi:hypothetical protein